MDRNPLNYADAATPQPTPPPNRLKWIGVVCAVTGWALLSVAAHCERSWPAVAAWLDPAGSRTVITGLGVGLLAVITGPGRRRATILLAIQFAACLVPIVVLGPGD